MQFDLIILQWV